MNDHTLLEVRGRYITDDPTINLHFAQKKKKKEKKLKKIKKTKEKDSEKRDIWRKETRIRLHVYSDTWWSKIPCVP